jgi:hypothetical protein
MKESIMPRQEFVVHVTRSTPFVDDDNYRCSQKGYDDICAESVDELYEAMAKAVVDFTLYVGTDSAGKRERHRYGFTAEDYKIEFSRIYLVAGDYDEVRLRAYVTAEEHDRLRAKFGNL